MLIMRLHETTLPVGFAWLIFGQISSRGFSHSLQRGGRGGEGGGGTRSHTAQAHLHARLTRAESPSILPQNRA